MGIASHARFYNASKPDTVDFYHIYFNGVEIYPVAERKPNGMYEFKPAILQALKDDDILLIHYFSDTGIWDECQLEFRNRSAEPVLSVLQKSTWNFELSGKMLKDYLKPGEIYVLALPCKNNLSLMEIGIKE
ncbi:MAG TPA: hypothetical protein VK177_09175 [Flavobacteriales bacterium]|nr:hypothetical protein [Flavobacteriales bacterium]